jgi:hypothetical protein
MNHTDVRSKQDQVVNQEYSGNDVLDYVHSFLVNSVKRGSVEVNQLQV